MTTQKQKEKHRERGRGRKAFWILVTVGLAVTLIAATRGHERGRRAGHRAGSHDGFAVERIEQLLAEDGEWFDRLGIADEQRQQIAAVLRESAPRFEAIAAERDELRDELSRAFADPDADEQRLEELRWQAAEVATRAIDEGFDAAVELTSVLTPEQRRELVRHWEERR